MPIEINARILLKRIERSQYLGYSGMLFDGPGHRENVYPIDIAVILEYSIVSITYRTIAWPAEMNSGLNI
ncbi:hypothetical protein MNBD_GAMMA11-496 [hydrothermal vent metagenome]|uniref:Uncharacterized protein n=1 Tax=hydrothermal vent metagenome TaxID=652676 RepID=A0A3B0WYE2_9ZZZZ